MFLHNSPNSFLTTSETLNIFEERGGTKNWKNRQKRARTARRSPRRTRRKGMRGGTPVKASPRVAARHTTADTPVGTVSAGGQKTLGSSLVPLINNIRHIRLRWFGRTGGHRFTADCGGGKSIEREEQRFGSAGACSFVRFCARFGSAFLHEREIQISLRAFLSKRNEQTLPFAKRGRALRCQTDQPRNSHLLLYAR